jgi:hypothetical protein
VDEITEKILRWFEQCDEARGNKISKSGYKNENRREKKKRKVKKKMIEYD